MKNMNELPLIQPVYSTHHNGFLSALFAENPTIKNWYLTNIMMLRCKQEFLAGYTSPRITVEGLNLYENPYIEKQVLPIKFLGGYAKPIIRNFIDQGYYVYVETADDYYIEGKSYYKKRHMIHDGGICGYNQENKTFCLYAYDSNWVYRKFWSPQDSLIKGMRVAVKEGKSGGLYGLRPTTTRPIAFSAKTALRKINLYLDSSYEKYPEKGEGKVYGTIVHNYIAKYIGMLYDGDIPYARMDWRVLRMIWEHKKVMLERIELIEEKMQLKHSVSSKYRSLVEKANHARMLYAAHHMKRRDELLPIIQSALLEIKDEEETLLYTLLSKC